MFKKSLEIKGLASIMGSYAGELILKWDRLQIDTSDAFEVKLDCQCPMANGQADRRSFNRIDIHPYRLVIRYSTILPAPHFLGKLGPVGYITILR
jgi:hypothetical protein